MISDVDAELIYRLNADGGHPVIALDRLRWIYSNRPQIVVHKISMNEKHLLSSRTDDNFDFFTYDPVKNVYYYYNKENVRGCAYLPRKSYEIKTKEDMLSYIHDGCMKGRKDVCTVNNRVWTVIVCVALHYKIFRWAVGAYTILWIKHRFP